MPSVSTPPILKLVKFQINGYAMATELCSQKQIWSTHERTGDHQESGANGNQFWSSSGVTVIEQI